MVKGLLNAGAQVNIQDAAQGTALMIAADKNYIDIVKELIKAGADLAIKDTRGRTALMQALRTHQSDPLLESSQDQSDICKELLRAIVNSSI